MTRLATCAAAVAAAMLLIAADTVPDPLAPAHQGLVQCYDPHTDVKTCRAIGAYSFESEGTIQNEATIALPDGRDTLIMKTTTPVTVRDGAICGPVSKDAIKSASIFLNGRRLPPDDANQIRVQLMAVMADRLGKEICTSYRAFKNEFYASVTIDGTPDSSGSDYVLWIKPDDGYTVVPSQ
jgi:hypothetical protein